MRFGLPHLAMLRCLESAAAGTVGPPGTALSGHPGRDGWTSTNPGLGSEPPDASSKLKNLIEELESKLDGTRRSIMAIVGDEKLRINGPNMRKYIAVLHKGFFDLLGESKLYLFLHEELKATIFTMSFTNFRKYSPHLYKETEARILGMSPEDFREKCGEWYDKRARFCMHKIEECKAQRKDMKSQIAKEMRRHKENLPGARVPDRRKASGSTKRLKALKASLEECGTKRRKYSISKLKGYCSKLESLSHKVVGKDSIFSVYRSYLADQKTLEEKKDEYAGLNGRSSQHEACKDCVICLKPLKPSRDMINCASRHKFHASCLCEWRKHGNETCPVCEAAFSGEQWSRLQDYEARCTDYLHNLCSDLDYLCNPDNDRDLERKYACAGGRQAENHFFVPVYNAIRRCVLDLKNHPRYATTFGSPESGAYRRFYIPQNIVSYFENIETSRHDPRSRGFLKHKAVLVNHVLSYKKQLKASPCLQSAGRRVFLNSDIARPIRYVLNTFCAVDCLTEYLCMGLCEITDTAERRSAIMNDPAAYPALHGLMSRFPDHSFGQIYCTLMLAVCGVGSTPTLYSRQWLRKLSEVFFEVISEI